jgi:hypothetical protein
MCRMPNLGTSTGFDCAYELDPASYNYLSIRQTSPR